MKVVAKAPGKAILCGEHFVVHGSYALACAIDRVAICEVEGHDGLEVIAEDLGLIARPPHRVPRELEGLSKALMEALRLIGSTGRHRLRIRSTIPPSAGLGSSAAVAVASLAALLAYEGEEPKREDVIRLAGIAEAFIHGNPSGIDAQVATLGGFILFRRPSEVREIDAIPLELVIASCKGGRSTAEMVRRFTSRREEVPGIFRELVASSSHMAQLAARSLIEGDRPTLASIMNLHHLVLAWFGVSSQELDRLVDEALRLGASAAKLTGAGGGGSIVALPGKASARSIAQGLKEMGYEAFTVRPPCPGLTIEREE